MNEVRNKGDIGGGSFRTVSRSLMMSDNVSVGVMVGSSQVEGKKSTVLDCRIFFVISINTL